MVTVNVKLMGVEDERQVNELYTIKTGNTLPEAIEAIEEVSGFPLSGKLNQDYGMLVNGRSYNLLLREKYILSEGDMIVILPKLGGG